MKGLHMVTFILLVVGGLNWGLIGFFEYDLVATLLGDASTISRVVYALVGVAALYMLVLLPGKTGKKKK